MDRIGLADTVQALRAELSEAAALASGQDIQFPVSGVELEFHVGVTKDADAKAALKFWVLELAAGGNYALESVQRVKITLDPPVDANGQRVLVTRGSNAMP